MVPILALVRLLPTRYFVYAGIAVAVILGHFAHVSYAKGKVETAYKLKLKNQKAYYDYHLEKQREIHETVLVEHKRDSQVIIATMKKDLDAYAAQKPEKEIIIKEVKKYVTVKADSNCTITDGFVSMYNETLDWTTPAVPEGGPKDADAASGVALSTVAEVSAANNIECTERGAVIAQWQAWYNYWQPIYDKYASVLKEASKKIPDHVE